MNVVVKKVSLTFFVILMFCSMVCVAADSWVSLADRAEKILKEKYDKNSAVGKALKKELSKILNGNYSEKSKIAKLKILIRKMTGESEVKNSRSHKDLIANYRESLVLVEGSKGVGSGFVSEIKGKKYIFTNAHVVIGNSKLRFKNLNGDKLATKGFYLNRDRDVFIAVLDTEKTDMKALKMYEDVTKLKIGTRIYVTGNSAGGGTVTKLPGKVKSVGPERIEVSAKFVTGNSGSPIMTADGRVVGIATYIIRGRTSWHNKDSEFTKNRRFGFRLDNIKHTAKTWQRLSMKRYKRDLVMYNRIKRANELGILLINDLVYDKKGDGVRLTPSNYMDYKEAQDIVKEWNMALNSSTFMNYSVFLDRMGKLISRPGKLCKNHRFYYQIFKNDASYIPHEEALNKAIAKEFKGFSQNIEARFNEYRNIRYHGRH